MRRRSRCYSGAAWRTGQGDSRPPRHRPVARGDRLPHLAEERDFIHLTERPDAPKIMEWHRCFGATTAPRCCVLRLGSTT